jgi:D-aminoacyl-tRNA deacylase
MSSVLIAASIGDPAAVNIAEKLIHNFDFKETGQTFAGKTVFKKDRVLLVYLDVNSVYAEDLDKHFNVDAIVFASRHESESGEPTLSVHAPGNLTSSSLHGGMPKSLAWACPQRMKAALTALKDANERFSLSYRVSLEATHHGPTQIDIPTLFVEIGSLREQWLNEEAGRAAAEAVWKAATAPVESRSAVGFGGGHYAVKHTMVTLKQNIAVGHIFPKYVLSKEIDANMIKLAFQKTLSKCDLAVIDWKGLRGNDREQLIKILTEYGVEIMRS